MNYELKITNYELEQVKNPIFKFLISSLRSAGSSSEPKQTPIRNS